LLFFSPVSFPFFLSSFFIIITAPVCPGSGYLLIEGFLDRAHYLKGRAPLGFHVFGPCRTYSVLGTDCSSKLNCCPVNQVCSFIQAVPFIFIQNINEESKVKVSVPYMPPYFIAGRSNFSAISVLVLTVPESALWELQHLLRHRYGFFVGSRRETAAPTSFLAAQISAIFFSLSARLMERAMGSTDFHDLLCGFPRRAISAVNLGKAAHRLPKGAQDSGRNV